MGGVGKTQLAAHYARTAWQSGELDVLVWITASSRPAVVAGYAQAAIELLATDSADPERAAEQFLAWLEPKPQINSCRWLVVLDDVADPNDLRGLWPPSSPSGRSLATTRRRDAAIVTGARQLVEIGLFTPAQALTYLTDALAAYGLVEPEQQLTGLARDLGHLPLALSQAAAYVIDTGTSCAAYRTRLADRTGSLAHAAPDALPDDQTHTVAAAWRLSVDRADALRPAGLARLVLQIGAFLDPNGIPTAALTSHPVLAYLSESQASNAIHSKAQITADDVELAFAALRRLSLIDRAPQAAYQPVRIHQLIQRATRDTLTPGQFHRLARIAADALMASWPEVERDTTLAQTLRANASVLLDCAENALCQPSAHPVVYRIGNSLGEAGQAAAARDYFQHLTTVATRLLGPDHPDPLTCRRHLAIWQGVAGDEAGAAAALSALLDEQIQVLGAHHPHVLATRTYLADWRGRSGDALGASAAFAQLLEDQIRLLGSGHPDTLDTRHNLARWRGEAGDPAGAYAAFSALLEEHVRLLGGDHPFTLVARYWAAQWLGRAGNAQGAAVALAEQLEDQIRVFGADHPHVLAVRTYLAEAQGQAGDAAGAVVVLSRVLQDRLRVLGPDHPHTLGTRHALARWRGEGGDMPQAAADLARLLADQERVLGSNNPSTVATRDLLAQLDGRSAGQD